MTTHNSQEYKQFKFLEHWKAEREIVPAEELVDSTDPLFPLFEYIYDKTRELYAQISTRKNGEDAFIHPVNVVWDLTKANVHDMTSLCVGMLHDYVEEAVDIHKDKKSIKKDKEGIKTLDNYELKIFKSLNKELHDFCKDRKLPVEVVNKIIKVTKLLTKHKRHFYYTYISGIFQCRDDSVREMAIRVKLADRTHNILSVECFDEQNRLNQCFKNYFLLNNTKKFLLDKYGPNIFSKQNFSSTERLFNKCAKATYDAYLTILHLCHAKGIGNVKSMIQLAFKKFAFEQRGLGKITKVDSKEIHPLRLFQGIVRKYDARLHYEMDTYEQIKNDEYAYLELFFSDFKLDKDQLQAIIDYKDAYAFKESLGRILYQHNYFVSRFLWEELTQKGRISNKKDEVRKTELI
jgi:hypothetical protein